MVLYFRETGLDKCKDAMVDAADPVSSHRRVPVHRRCCFPGPGG